MLRYIYFVSLLLCISLSEEEYLRSGKRYLRNSNRNGYSKGKISRKREDYETFDDKDSVAHIDVASFIQSPDDISIERNQPFEELLEERKQAFKDYADYNPVVNTDAELEKDQSHDYQSLESNNIPEVNIYSKKHIVLPYFNINKQPVEGINNGQFRKVKNTRENVSHNTNTKYSSHLKKKCALKNMKIPFFSHDKAKSTKMKKNKKRKMFGFCSTQKSTTSSKVTDSILNNNKLSHMNSGEQQKSFKVNKRSYFERLCPACRQKFILGSNADWLDKCRRTANNVIHNGRQYYANKKNDIKDTENIDESNNYELNLEKQDTKNGDVNDPTEDDRIWKESDQNLLRGQRKIGVVKKLFVK